MTTLTPATVTAGAVLGERERLVLLAAEHAALLAAARAGVAAAELGHPDPLAFIRHELAERGQLPPAGARPVELLAVTAAARMAGQVRQR
ncbi:hypothetical protein ABZU32_35730 [Sphaerisporangium sp. NPDC005288]|uniref:hypothetical protein n=1 Tax=Sphaerisporangium sp. NPDC005288 TaxID=3155114 RepID=UPI0033AB580C